MYGLTCAASNAVCNVQWGYLTIILVYLAFLCYWMLLKKHKEFDYVICAASGVVFLIGFIMAFFAKCPICWIFMMVGLIILDTLFGYFLFLELKKYFALRNEKPAELKKEEKKSEKVVEPAPVKKEEPAVKKEKPAPVKEKETESVVETEEVGASLKESISIMDALVSQSRVTKKSICDYLSATFGDKVELNNRPNRTKNDRLPMADTHYVFVDGKKVCFVYVYQNDAGGVLLLVKTTKEHYKMIAEKHAGVKRSAFPRRGEWYSIIVDDTYHEHEIYKILCDAVSIASIEGFTPTDWTFEIVDTVKSSDVDKLLSDDEAESLVENDDRVVDKTKKGFVNIDTLGQYFNNGETVTLEEIKKRVPGFDKNMTFCKVLARGKLDKDLTVDLDDYSIQAIKMILLTGGKVFLPKK